MFVGKRKEALEQAGISKYDGTLVYVLGEISSRIKILNPKIVNIGVCVFVTSITFWDTESIIKNRKNKVDNDIIFSVMEEGEENE